MKIVKAKSSISAAIHGAKSRGTTFYKYTIDTIIEMFSEPDTNVWIGASFVERGWDAIDFSSNLYGSRVVNDVLYLCVSDGYDIDIDDDVYDPETAIDEIGIDGLSDYIKEGTENIAYKYITEYEIKYPDFDKWAEDLITSGASFTKMVSDYQEFK